MRARHILALSAFCCVALAAHFVLADNPRLAQLQWLEGRWLGVYSSKKAGEKSTHVNEDWRTLVNRMESIGYTMKGDSLVDFERVDIRESGPYLLYEAHPMGQEPAVFHSIQIGEKSVVFENLAHDFPQRVAYELVNDDSLLAWIEGPGKDGKTKRIQFPYRRVK